MNNTHITLLEYQHISSGENTDPEKRILETDSFNALERFILNNEIHDETHVSQFLKIGMSARKKVLTAQNYVGVIETLDGTVIEILPKIYKNEQQEDARKLLMQMLAALDDMPFKYFQNAPLRTEKLSIMEIFISMFLTELHKLIRKGIKSDYVSKEDNLNVLKGKIKWSEHIRKNTVHKERFYVEYDEYSPDRAENRLIKATLNLLKKRAKSSKNQKGISECMFVFEDVCESANIDIDFSKVKTNRTMRDYEKVLAWCNVFLRNKSFTNYHGNDVAFALLVPMEKIFEAFVTKWLKKTNKHWQLKTQEARFSLVDKHIDKPMFKIRPDIIMRHEQALAIIDTKWKLLNSKTADKYGISQSDMYQLYAYGKKYSSKEATIPTLYLVYPMCDTLIQNIDLFHYCTESGLRLKVVTFDIRYACEKLY